MKSRYPVWLWMALILLSAGAAGAQEINIGALSDMSGATSDAGKDYALGISEAVRYVNDTGGINGKTLRLFQFDYGYRIPEVLIKYRFFKEKKCVAILGWGTGDTEALVSSVARDNMPYVSAYYAGHLCDPRKTPYNLFFATDYSTQARGLVTAWFDKKWPSRPDFGKRKPLLVCAYMTASPLSSDAIKAAKDQAAMLGFDIGPDQDISLFAIDTQSRILALKEIKPDVILHTNTLMSVAATIRDADKLALGADHIILNCGFDENLADLAGKATEGIMGCAPWAFFGQNVKLMDNVMAYARKYNPGIPPEKRTIHTVQAWANVLGLSEALRRADKAGDLSGSGILKKGFETLRDYEIGLGMAPVSFSATDHRPQSQANIYEIKGGKFLPLDEVNLQTRWPEKWKNEWIGW